MVNFNEIYHFSRFQKGPTFSRGGGGGVQLFPGGSNCLFPIETHITCDFPGGSPPLDPHLNSHFCHLLIISNENILGQDQDRQKIGPDLDPNCLTL